MKLAEAERFDLRLSLPGLCSLVSSIPIPHAPIVATDSGRGTLHSEQTYRRIAVSAGRCVVFHASTLVQLNNNSMQGNFLHPLSR